MLRCRGGRDIGATETNRPETASYALMRYRVSLTEAAAHVGLCDLRINPPIQRLIAQADRTTGRLRCQFVPLALSSRERQFLSRWIRRRAPSRTAESRQRSHAGVRRSRCEQLRAA